MYRRLLPSPTRSIETDVCVVGAGLLGLAHALEARRRGLSVVVLEREPRAAGASVRHSGHLFFSALRTGAALDSAPLARERWLELAQRAGTVAEEGGTLIIARSRDELAVMESAAAEPARDARMRTAKKVGRLAPIPVDGVMGAFHAKHDLRIGPRSAPAALARLLSRDPAARIEWGTHAHEVEPGVVHTGSLQVRCDAIVVCPGPDHRTLPSALRPMSAGLTLRESQMLRVRSPAGRRYRQTLTTGLSLLEYPAFHDHGAFTKLRERLELEFPEMVEHGVSMALTQLANGDLVLGSTATYSDIPSPFSRERLDELLLADASALLGTRLSVLQRWRSLQASLPDGPEDFLTTRPMPGVRVVVGVRPTAAALCHAQAETILGELLAGPTASDMYITVRDLRRGAVPAAGGVRDHAQAFGAARRRG